MLIATAILGLILGQTPNPHPKIERPVWPQYYVRPTHGVSVSSVDISVKVSGICGTIAVPLPSRYEGQTPISLSVQAEPPSSMKHWRWIDRSDGLNSVIEAEVAPVDKPTTLTVHATVLCPIDTVLRLQPRLNKPWLAPSPCVQAEDSEIRILAKRTRHEGHEGGGQELIPEKTVPTVVRWVALNLPREDSSGPVDAKHALSSGGDSLSHANLCVAILRAKGVPARTVCALLTWAPAIYAPYWLVEYWSNEEGSWQFVDPTIGLLEPLRNSIVVLAISGPEDEAKSFSANRLPGVRPGTPYLSVPEISGDLRGSPMDGFVTSAPSRPARAFQLGLHYYRTFSFSAGARILTAGYRRWARVLEAAQHGHQIPLSESEVEKAVKNPGDFARLLDSK
jgi:Transglutaminase-like superfamily